jgi:bifunctional non-homologous end joining protein LigD
MLDEYKRKRNFNKTPEPSAKLQKGPGKSLKYVVQKHTASHLHYDFRLECDGVLLSWAVPKGPSLNPADKRLAMRTEDHPYDYKDFEGIIPAGEYGGGEVIIWDFGSYLPMQEGALIKDQNEAEAYIRDGARQGKLSFFLDGVRLKGGFTLVRIKNSLKKSDKEWLLIKYEDAYSSNVDITQEDTSVVSGLKNEDLASGPNAGKTKVWSSKSGRQRAELPELKPMFAVLSDKPFSKDGWMYEPKLDGYRALAYINSGSATLYSRTSRDFTHQFPNLVQALSKLGGDFILDGEIIALDESGKPSFQQLQQRGQLNAKRDIERADISVPAFFYVFDLLYADGQSLTSEPLSKRKALLKKMLKTSTYIKLVEPLDCDGLTAYKICIENGLEGVVAKDPNSKYESGRRSPHWLKVKGTQSGEFNICGFTKGEGGRGKTFGALVVGYYENGELTYAGRVGTGFDTAKLDDLMRKMQPLIRKENPFGKKTPSEAQTIWLSPTLVAEIKYSEWTNDKNLRAPVFLRLRDDIEVKQTGPAQVISVSKTGAPEMVEKAKKTTVVKDQLTAEILEQLSTERESTTLEIGNDKLPLTHLDKVLWPGGDGFAQATKRDYLVYLAKEAPIILTHLRNRPITLKRFPDGVLKQTFYQKHWDNKLPSFVDHVTYFSESNSGDEKFLLCNNLPTLLWLGQLADLELHVVHTRIDKEPDAHDISDKMTGSLKAVESSLMNYPDFIVLDLDPYIYSGKEGKNAEPELNKKGFETACKIAHALKEMLDALSIKAFIKTSGKTGLHIYIPIVRSLDYDTVRDVAGSIGRFLMKEHADDITMEWSVSKRTGKIFFDHNMNARGKTLASAYSPRNAIEASVSTPLHWDEVGKFYPTEFTIFSLPERLEKVGDIWADILDHKNDMLTLLRKGKQEELSEQLTADVEHKEEPASKKKVGSAKRSRKS